MGQLLLETILDVGSLLLIMLLVGNERISLKTGYITWLAVILLFCLADNIQFIPTESITQIVLESEFEILPVQSVVGVVGLLLLTLLMNSLILKGTHVEIIFITMLGFIITLLIRLVTFAAIDILLISQFLFRPFIFFLTIGIYIFAWKKLSLNKQGDFNLFVKWMIVSMFGFLLYFTMSFTYQDGLRTLPIFIGFIVLTVIAMLGWLFYEQKRTQIMENRMQATEKYLPIIDELVAEVRSRQHEFSNKLLAISSVLQATDDIIAARGQVSEYVANVKLKSGQYELLNMDHKVIGGFLYTKMKRAEQLKMNLHIDRSVSVAAFPCEDFDLIEVLGILIDNAIEASFGGDTIFIRMKEVNNRYELTVSNPAAYVPNEKFMEMFQLGYSTKSIDSPNRGFGLYNVSQIAKQYNGKIIARNEQDNGQMITIGIQF